MATNTTLNTGTVPIPVASGGTGDASLTAYAVLCGGTTSTGALQPIAGVGTSGQVLTSNGAGALPTFQAGGGGGSGGLSSLQIFTANGTWNRPVGITHIVIEVLGAGGGGGSSASNNITGGGGSAGAYAWLRLDVTAIASVAVTIGAGGAGAVNANGGYGGTSSFGAYVSCTGGSGGYANGTGTGIGGVPTGGNMGAYGQVGSPGGDRTTVAGASGTNGWGANTIYGTGGTSSSYTYEGIGYSATLYGAGGGGSSRAINAQASGAGGQGVVIVWEYA